MNSTLETLTMVSMWTYVRTVGGAVRNFCERLDLISDKYLELKSQNARLRLCDSGTIRPAQTFTGTHVLH